LENYKLFYFFAIRFVHLHIENVIQKGGGNRPYETLATLAIRQEGAKFYSNFVRKITKNFSTPF